MATYWLLNVSQQGEKTPWKFAYRDELRAVAESNFLARHKGSGKPMVNIQPGLPKKSTAKSATLDADTVTSMWITEVEEAEDGE